MLCNDLKAHFGYKNTPLIKIMNKSFSQNLDEPTKIIFKF